MADRKSSKYSSKAKEKIKTTLREGYSGKLHSGSKKGPVVTNPEQMKAIALSESRRAGIKTPGRK